MLLPASSLLLLLLLASDTVGQRDGTGGDTAPAANEKHAAAAAPVCSVKLLPFRHRDNAPPPTRMMPVLGLGTWKSAPGEIGDAVRAALRHGYRHLDCAAVYGNEKEVGNVLREMVSGVGKDQIPREELFVTSKLWNSEHDPANVKAALQQTLSDLQLEYLDLYLIHWPQGFEKVRGTHTGRPQWPNGSIRYDFVSSTLSTWRALEGCVRDGLVRSLGLSNFNSKQIEALEQHAEIMPSVLQVESHPYFAQQRLVDFAHSRDIVVTAYSPLASGAKSSSGYTVPHHPVLARVGAKYGATAAQVAIAWQVARNVSVIPKSVSEARIVQNLEAAAIPLVQADVEVIDDLDEGLRIGWGGPKQKGQPPRDAIHPSYPFRWEESDPTKIPEF